jgi:hypothetical protein
MLTVRKSLTAAICYSQHSDKKNTEADKKEIPAQITWHNKTLHM